MSEPIGNTKSKNKGGYTNPTLVAEIRTRIAKLYCEGKTQYEIAKVEGISQPAVSNHLKKIRDLWRDRAVADLAQREEEELAKIDNLEAIAMAAWLRSCEDAETRLKKLETIPVKSEDGESKPKGKKPLGKKAPVVEIKRVFEIRRVGQSGNPAFLTQIQWCIETRLKLIGKLSEKNSTTANIQVNNWDGIYRVQPPTESLTPPATYDKVLEEFKKLISEEKK